MEVQQKPLMTPAEAAKFLAISTRQLRNLTTSGAIAYINIGRFDRETRRYRSDDLEAFVTSRRRQRHANAGASSKSNVVYSAGEFRRLLETRAAKVGP